MTLIVCLVLLGVALGAMLLAPVVLERGTWRVHHPELCLALWYLVFGSGVAAAVVGVGMAVVAGIRARMTGEAEGWLSPVVDQLGAWGGLAVAGAVGSFVGAHVVGMVVAERRLRTDFSRLAAGARERAARLDGLVVHVVQSQEPFVCALRRGRGEVIVSSRIVEQLTPQQFAAVLGHERAHLRSFHDVALRIARLNAACLPGWRGPVAMERATGLLTELIADRAVARRFGAQVVADTLGALAELGGPERATLRLRARLLIT